MKGPEREILDNKKRCRIITIDRNIGDRIRNFYFGGNCLLILIKSWLIIQQCYFAVLTAYSLIPLKSNRNRFFGYDCPDGEPGECGSI